MYVNESSFCCVTAENTDAELESSRPEMEAQVDDLLCFFFQVYTISERQASHRGSYTRSVYQTERVH